MLLTMLHENSWAEAGHFAVVDACEHGWDTGAEWIAAQIHCGEKTALDAGRALEAAGTYTNRHLHRKKMKDGGFMVSTHFTVSAKWTTRNGKRNPELRYVVLDTAFLDRHPRQSDLLKRVYHVVAYEQWRVGGCALGPGRIAEALGVEPTASKTATERVRRALWTLRASGEIVGEAGTYHAPHYAYAPHDDGRFQSERIRAGLAGQERGRIAKSLHSAVSTTPLGGEHHSTQPDTTTRNYKERKDLTSASAREHGEGQEEQERMDGERQDAALDHDPDALGELEARLTALVPGTRARKRFTWAWGVLTQKYDFNSAAVLAVARRHANEQLDRVADVPDLRGRHAALKTACQFLADPLDAIHAELRHAENIVDADRALDAGDVHVDLDAAFAGLIGGAAAAPTQTIRVSLPDLPLAA